MTKTLTKTPDSILQTKASASAERIVGNILATWDRATPQNREDGAQWYMINGQAMEAMAASAGVSIDTAATVTAHLSPRIHWAKNLVAASAVLHNLPVTAVMSRSLENAKLAILAYLAGDDPMGTLRGPKTSNFARNLLGDTEAVTIDTWAAKVALGDREDTDRILGLAGVYDALAHCYREAARRVGVSPSTMQATTWIVARNGRAS